MHGNPFQYSCLENPMDREAWRAIVHRVTQSQTWLKQLSKQANRYTVGSEMVYNSFIIFMCGRKNNCTQRCPSHNARTCEYVTLSRKRDFADVTKDFKICKVSWIIYMSPTQSQGSLLVRERQELAHSEKMRWQKQRSKLHVGPWAKKCGQPLEAKGEKETSSWSLQREHSILSHFRFLTSRAPVGID